VPPSDLRPPSDPVVAGAVPRSRRQRRQPGRDVLRAVAFSLIAHAALLLLAARGVVRRGNGDRDTRVLAYLGDAAGEAAPAWLDVELAGPGAEPPPLPEPAETLPTVAGDQDHPLANPTAPGRGISTVAGAAAPDSGDGERRPLAPASRRDLSTLHARQSDGAETYHVEREATAARASSPQPIRQEPVVGMGDSSRTREPATLEPPSPELPAPTEADDDDTEKTARAENEAQSADGRERTRGDGPLDGEQGPRRFEVEMPGPARETQWVRAASDENHPGRLELSAPGATGGDVRDPGRGPSDRPGVISAAGAGTAAALAGAEQDLPQGPLALSTSEREYQRTQAEIRRRVASALRFPKRLALMLEQGETVVRFVVRPDGRLAGAVQVLKSAGFDEFDAAAVSAVNRAAPFPATGRALSVSMPIAFDNPLVR
jgi:TonB family protein